MERSGEPGTEGEANEHMDSLLFLADALDSVQMDDTRVPRFRGAGRAVLLRSSRAAATSSAAASAIIRNYARTTTEALIARSGIKAAFGYNPMSTRDWKGTRPHTRMGALSLLRARLAAGEAQDRRSRRKGAKAAADTP